MGSEINKNACGVVFNIQRYNTHDGDGIRTLVFLKGCALRCQWCANPEGLSGDMQLRFLRNRCIGCGACAAQCPTGAVKMSDGVVYMDWPQCNSCGICTLHCLSGAREIVGRRMTVLEVMDEVRRDFVFFRRSGGGMTLSGGETMLQADFALALLRMAKEEGMQTAVETCGCAPWENYQQALPYTDLFFFDLKHMQDAAHRRLTGRSNAQIIENARRLSEAKARIIFRTPVVPGLNDSEENIRATARFAAELHAEALELLPYHAMGVAKYEQIGKTYSLNEIKAPSETRLHLLRQIVDTEFARVK